MINHKKSLVFRSINNQAVNGMDAIRQDFGHYDQDTGYSIIKYTGDIMEFEFRREYEINVIEMLLWDLDTRL